MAPSKQVTLALAAFMDSPERAALDRPGEDVREIVSRFLGVCYDDLGIEPKRLDGHHVEAALTQLLPGRFKRGEELRSGPTFCEHSSHTWKHEVVANSFEVERLRDRSTTSCTVRGQPPRAADVPQDPSSTRREDRRNDPCICGSGKKFKKCCGK